MRFFRFVKRSPLVGGLTIFTILLIPALILATLALGYISDEPYPPGRDTYKRFGDGRIEIMRGGTNKYGDEKLAMWDHLESKVIENSIYDYKEISPHVYTIGERGYTALNYETGEYVQSDSLDTFTQEQRDILSALEAG